MLPSDAVVFQGVAILAVLAVVGAAAAARAFAQDDVQGVAVSASAPVVQPAPSA
jgi:hypothetical protein